MKRLFVVMLLLACERQSALYEVSDEQAHAEQAMYGQWPWVEKVRDVAVDDAFPMLYSAPILEQPIPLVVQDAEKVVGRLYADGTCEWRGTKHRKIADVCELMMIVTKIYGVR
jgi:hypothetical protein